MFLHLSILFLHFILLHFSLSDTLLKTLSANTWRCPCLWRKWPSKATGAMLLIFFFLLLWFFFFFGHLLFLFASHIASKFGIIQILDSLQHEIQHLHRTSTSHPLNSTVKSEPCLIQVKTTEREIQQNTASSRCCVLLYFSMPSCGQYSTTIMDYIWWIILQANSDSFLIVQSPSYFCNMFHQK